MQPRHKPAIGVVVALACLLGICFFGMFRWMVVRWDQPNSYYSHGWLIPPISAVLLYLKRRQIAESCRHPRPCPWGLAIALPCLLLHLLGAAWRVHFFSGFAMLGVLVGLLLTLYGWEMVRLTLFPIAFLAFMVPLPEVLIEKISFNMKLMAAGAATGALEVLGLAAVREGSYIHIPTGPVVVDDVCSGLKYLISLTAFGALYAYVSRVRGWMTLLLFSLAIPIAFLANVLRVILMVLVGYRWGVDATQKWYFHDFFGFALFVVAFLMLFMFESILLRRFSGRRPDSGDTGEDSEGTAEDRPEMDSPPVAQHSPARRPPVKTVVVSLAVCAVLSTYFVWPRSATSVAPMLRSLPLRMGQWQGSDYAMDDRVYEILGTRDVLSRVYRNPSHDDVQLVVVMAQQMRRRTHPPEQCLKGEGYSVLSSATRQISTGALDVPELELRELILAGPRGRRVVWYIYKSGPRLHTSYWRHQATVAMRRLKDRNAADVLIRLDAPAGNDVDSARLRLHDFLSHAIGPIMTHLP